MEKPDLKDTNTPIECEYLIGDDTCSAVKEEQASSLRAKACQSNTRDKCCYKCNLRTNCDIRCDLIENRKEGKEEQPSASPASEPDYAEIGECGACAFYLKPKCPRGYNSDQELWRRQEGCEIFQPRQEP